MARKIEVQIVGDASSLKRAVGQSESSLGTLGSTVGTLAKTAAFAAGAAGVGAIAITLRQGIKEYTESAKVAAQTNAVIKSTGGVANVSAKDVDRLAESLMRKSGVDDEAIKSSENLLLGFTNIRNEVGKGNDIFNQATQAVLDYSVRTGKDAAGAAVLFGKALNDPIGGLAKLSRVGIQFTDAQKEQIKAMTEAGDVAGAQQIILGELEKRYGGAAEAAGKTLPGQLAVLKESFNNFAGDLIAQAIPTVQRFVDFINNIVAAPTIKAKLTVLWEGLESVASDLNERLRAEFAKIDWADLFISGFKAIDFSAVFMGVFHALVAISTTQWEIISSIWLGAWRAILSGLAAIGGQIVGAVTQTAANVVSAIRNGIAGLPGFVTTVFQAIVSAIRNAAGSAATAAINLGERVVAGVMSGLASLAGKVRDKLNDIIREVAKTALNAFSAAIAIGTSIVTGVISGLAGLASRVGQAIADGISAGIRLAGRLKHGSGDFMSTIHEIGEPMAEGIIEGLVGGLGDLGTELSVAIEEGFQDARAGYAQSVNSFTSWAKGIWDAETAAAAAVAEFGQKATGGGAAGASPFGGSVPPVAVAPAPVTINNYATIKSDRDFEDMVRTAMNNPVSRQGFA